MAPILSKSMDASLKTSPSRYQFIHAIWVRLFTHIKVIWPQCQIEATLGTRCSQCMKFKWSPAMKSQKVAPFTEKNYLLFHSGFCKTQRKLAVSISMESARWLKAYDSPTWTTLKTSAKSLTLASQEESSKRRSPSLGSTSCVKSSSIEVSELASLFVS